MALYGPKQLFITRTQVGPKFGNNGNILCPGDKVEMLNKPKGDCESRLIKVYLSFYPPFLFLSLPRYSKGPQ